MKRIFKSKNIKVSEIHINNDLTRHEGKNLFPEKMEKAKKAFDKPGFPKSNRIHKPVS